MKNLFCLIVLFSLGFSFPTFAVEEEVPPVDEVVIQPVEEETTEESTQEEEVTEEEVTEEEATEEEATEEEATEEEAEPELEVLSGEVWFKNTSASKDISISYKVCVETYNGDWSWEQHCAEEISVSVPARQKLSVKVPLPSVDIDWYFAHMKVTKVETDDGEAKSTFNHSTLCSVELGHKVKEEVILEELEMLKFDYEDNRTFCSHGGVGGNA